ncbi:hypothetical protein NL676_009995 [Syzygium grande]|nr:hypothetical protein NL676_009995 [Syzygium grande]
MLKPTYRHFKEDFVGREDSVKVLAPEYHVKDILTDILVELIPDQREGVMHMRDDELFDTLYKIQQEKRCIVVLDYIWTKEARDNLHASFPVENTRSKLLITTRNKDVAEYLDPHGFFHELQCLSDLESWDLLRKRVFPKTKVRGNPLFRSLSRSGLMGRLRGGANSVQSFFERRWMGGGISEEIRAIASGVGRRRRESCIAGGRRGEERREDPIISMVPLRCLTKCACEWRYWG